MQQEFMGRAIELSRVHMRAGGDGPFGAVIVKGGAIIAEGYNAVISSKDPTALAALAALAALDARCWPQLQQLANGEWAIWVHSYQPSLEETLMLQLKQVFPPPRRPPDPRAGGVAGRLRGPLSPASPSPDTARRLRAPSAHSRRWPTRSSRSASPPHSALFQGLSNLFQPPDSTFTAGYQCAFRARTQDGQAQTFSVSLLLTRTLSFAEHTQWERLQILPITYVTDETTGRAGYGVFKYLEPSS